MGVHSQRIQNKAKQVGGLCIHVCILFPECLNLRAKPPYLVISNSISALLIQFRESRFKYHGRLGTAVFGAAMTLKPVAVCFCLCHCESGQTVRVRPRAASQHDAGASVRPVCQADSER